MRRLINLLRAEFDYVLLQTPPVLPAVDARILGSSIDGTIIVARVE